MSDCRVIKKYPNRRLYDTTESRYITLSDIRQLVVDEEPFEVIDKKTGENITRSILLHVIAEQELDGECMLGEDFLAQIIRTYAGVMPEAVQHYLEQSLSLFVEQQRRASDSLRAAAETGLPGARAEVAQQSLGEWLELQRRMLQAFRPTQPDAAEVAKPIGSGEPLIRDP